MRAPTGNPPGRPPKPQQLRTVRLYVSAPTLADELEEEAKWLERIA